MLYCARLIGGKRHHGVSPLQATRKTDGSLLPFRPGEEVRTFEMHQIVNNDTERKILRKRRARQRAKRVNDHGGTFAKMPQGVCRDIGQFDEPRTVMPILEIPRIGRDQDINCVQSGQLSNEVLDEHAGPTGAA
jgi:hypothetical protein